MFIGIYRKGGGEPPAKDIDRSLAVADQFDGTLQFGRIDIGKACADVADGGLSHFMKQFPIG